MSTENKTVAAPAEDLSSSDAEARFNSYMCEARLAKERHVASKFSLIKFEDYAKWILDNQLPLR